MNASLSKHKASSQETYRPVFSQGRSALDQYGNIVGIQSQSTRNRSPVTFSTMAKVGEVHHNVKLSRKVSVNGPGKQHFCKIITRTLLLVLLYYVSSIGLTFYQKWLLKVRNSFTMSNLICNQFLFLIFQRLHYPLSIVITHLVVKFLLAAGCRIFWERWTNIKRPILNWQPYAVQLAPAGIASALDIGLSNWSFEFITVSL